MQAYFNWSGGKDSALALWNILQQQKFQVNYLLTNINSSYNRISMHGVRRTLVEAQAASIGIPLITVELPEQPSMSEYESAMMEKVTWMKKRNIHYSIFGDIFLEDLKKYREEKLGSAGIQCVFPLWKKDTAELMSSFLAAGFKSMVVCVNENFLDKSFCGRMIDESFCNDLPGNVDVCGENGEYHSFVFDGPIFSNSINFIKGEMIYKKYTAPGQQNDNSLPAIAEDYGFWFCDLLPG